MDRVCSASSALMGTSAVNPEGVAAGPLSSARGMLAVGRTNLDLFYARAVVRYLRVV